MTVADFVYKCESYEYSSENYEILKECSNIALMERYVKNLDFVTENYNFISENKNVFTEGYFQESIKTDIFIEEKEGILSKIGKGIKKVLATILRILAWVTKTLSSIFDKATTFLTNLANKLDPIDIETIKSFFEDISDIDIDSSSDDLPPDNGGGGAASNSVSPNSRSGSVPSDSDSTNSDSAASAGTHSGDNGVVDKVSNDEIKSVIEGINIADSAVKTVIGSVEKISGYKSWATLFELSSDTAIVSTKGRVDTNGDDELSSMVYKRKAFYELLMFMLRCNSKQIDVNKNILTIDDAYNNGYLPLKTSSANSNRLMDHNGAKMLALTCKELPAIIDQSNNQLVVDNFAKHMKDVVSRIMKEKDFCAIPLNSELLNAMKEYMKEAEKNINSTITELKTREVSGSSENLLDLQKNLVEVQKISAETVKSINNAVTIANTVTKQAFVINKIAKNRNAFKRVKGVIGHRYAVRNKKAGKR